MGCFSGYTYWDIWDVEKSIMSNSCRPRKTLPYRFTPKTNDELRKAVREWCVCEKTAYETYQSHISDWDVSQVIDMSCMFEGASSFNSDISNWDVSHVTNMNRMFSDAESFNGDISNWDVSQVTDMDWMFSGASSFNGDISKWDVSQVTNMNRMFWKASCPIPPWYAPYL